MKQNLALQRGFTILEFIVSFGIVAIILLAAIQLQNYIALQQDYTLNSYLTVETADATVTTLSRELRGARNAEDGAYALQVAGDQEIVFYSDYDNDDRIEKIHYFLDGAELKKGIIEPTDYPISYPQGNENIFVLSSDIRNGSAPVFSYYNGDWPTDTLNNPLPVQNRLASTRTIKIELIVNTNQIEIENDYETSSFVSIRSLKDNL
jgi:type II secretory pathway pseudopilin PulG